MSIANAIPVQTIPLTGPQRRSTAFGLGWAGLAQIVGLAIRFVSNVLLARLLAPQDYGLFGTAFVVLTTLEWLTDLGLQPGLLRHRRGMEPSFLQTGWWLGLGRATVITMATIAMAFPISEVCRQSALMPVLAALAARPMIMALRSPGMPLLRRQLNYRALFFEEVGQTVVATVVNVIAAFAWRSIWAIVAGTLAGAVTAVLISYILCPTRPRWHWDRVAGRELTRFGRAIFLNTMVMAVWLNLDRFLGLRWLSTEAMGLYAVAWNLAAVAEGLLTRACDVYYSLLTSREDPAEQARYHEAVMGRMTRIVMPIIALMSVVGGPVFRLLYDSRYAAAAPIFVLLLARLMYRIYAHTQFQGLLAAGRVPLATWAFAFAATVEIALLGPLTTCAGVYGLTVAALMSAAALTYSQAWLIWKYQGERPNGLVWTTVCIIAALLVNPDLSGYNPIFAAFGFGR